MKVITIKHPFILYAIVAIFCNKKREFFIDFLFQNGENSPIKQNHLPSEISTIITFYIIDI
jgi:hypothetical protein